MLTLIHFLPLQSPQVNGHGDPLSDLSVSGSMVSKSHENGTSGGKLPPKRGPIIDMRAMLNNAVKGATQEYMGGAEQDSSVSLGPLQMSFKFYRTP